MSYSSRVHRQRNPHSHDEGNKDAFFSKQHEAANEHETNSFFQTKLNVNEPGDQHEKEADAVADAVVNKTSRKPIAATDTITGIQRVPTAAEDEKLGTNDARMRKDKEIQEKPANKTGEEKEKKVQKKKEREEKDELGGLGSLQKKAELLPEEQKNSAGESLVSPALSNEIETGAGKGETLPVNILKDMNKAFGFDFREVRIHDNSESAEISQELQAQAFTHGNDIYFNQGKFDTESVAGKLLLAHELTHVVQQTGEKDSSDNKMQDSGIHTNPSTPQRDEVIEEEEEKKDKPTGQHNE